MLPQPAIRTTIRTDASSAGSAVPPVGAEHNRSRSRCS